MLEYIALKLVPWIDNWLDIPYCFIIASRLGSVTYSKLPHFQFSLEKISKLYFGSPACIIRYSFNLNWFPNIIKVTITSGCLYFVLSGIFFIPLFSWPSAAVLFILFVCTSVHIILQRIIAQKYSFFLKKNCTCVFSHTSNQKQENWTETVTNWTG